MSADADRSYTLTWQRRSGCLRAEVRGAGMSLAIASEYWTAVAAECHRQAATRDDATRRLSAAV